MKITILPNTTEEQNPLFLYLQSKNFMLNGRIAIARTAGEIGKVLMSSLYRSAIKEIRFDSELFIIQVDPANEFLTAVHHTTEEGVDVTNAEYYNIINSIIDETIAFIKLTDSNWKELDSLITETNVTTKAEASALLHEHTAERPIEE